MTTEVSFDDFSGFTEEEKREIHSEINLMFSLLEGTVPMARGFGLNIDILDNGLIDGGNMLTAELIDKIESMDKRVTVSSVKLKRGEDGTLYSNVRIERSNERE